MLMQNQQFLLFLHSSHQPLNYRVSWTTPSCPCQHTHLNSHQWKLCLLRYCLYFLIQLTHTQKKKLLLRICTHHIQGHLRQWLTLHSHHSSFSHIVDRPSRPYLRLFHSCFSLVDSLRCTEVYKHRWYFSTYFSTRVYCHLWVVWCSGNVLV